MTTEVQRELFTSKWGEDYQQEIFQEEPKVEGPSSVCDYLLQKGSCREFLVGPPIYYSYDSKTKYFIADFQEGWSIGKLVEKYQQQAFLGKSKAKELNNVCGFPDHEDIGRQTIHENKVATIFPYQLYNPIDNCMNTFLGQQERLFLEYASSSLSEDFSWCMLILIFKFQQQGGIRSSTQMLAWLHWRVEITQVNRALYIARSCT